ncbi:hypothetical protein ACFQUU_26640 [Herbaspirillum sp. GCM10030257]|uniref:hypothetical protein n=1 Tax=Herbaspirillum sp. GCM10030257 TaxID=3273393 RepID=UPI00362144C7
MKIFKLAAMVTLLCVSWTCSAAPEIYILPIPDGWTAAGEAKITKDGLYVIGHMRKHDYSQYAAFTWRKRDPQLTIWTFPGCENEEARISDMSEEKTAILGLCKSRLGIFFKNQFRFYFPVNDAWAKWDIGMISQKGDVVCALVTPKGAGAPYRPVRVDILRNDDQNIYQLDDIQDLPVKEKFSSCKQMAADGTVFTLSSSFRPWQWGAFAYDMKAPLNFDVQVSVFSGNGIFGVGTRTIGGKRTWGRVVLHQPNTWIPLAHSTSAGWDHVIDPDSISDDGKTIFGTRGDTNMGVIWREGKGWTYIDSLITEELKLDLRGLKSHWYVKGNPEATAFVTGAYTYDAASPQKYSSKMIYVAME